MKSSLAPFRSFQAPLIFAILKRVLRSALMLLAAWLLYAMPVDEARAVITYQSAGAVSYSASVAPPYPAAVAAGDLLVLIVGMKPSVANGGSVTTPVGWTLITSLTGAGGYGVTLGADTGNTNVFAYYKVAAGTESGSLSVPLTANNVAWAQMYRLTNATQDWSVAGTTGSDTTAGNVSITMSADPGVTAGDFILGAMVIPTDVTTPTQFSAEAFTQTGVTFGAVTEISEPDSTLGNDIGGFVVRSSVTAGPGTAAPVMTATAGGTTTNVRGPGIFIRVRATGAITYQTPGAINYSDSSAGTAVCALHPASIAAGDLLVTLIGMKPSAANSGSVTTPSGWTAVSGGSLTGAGGYGVTLGADTGNTNVFSFYRVAAGTEATEQCFTLTANNVSWAQMYRFSSTTQTWQLAGTTGPDITAGSVSITMSANPGVTVGDHILGAMVIPTDVTTPAQFSAEALTQTGVTFGAVTEISEPDSTTGNDIGGFVVRSTATAGTGSAAPVMTATAGGTTTNVRGPGVLIRIRDEPAFTQAAFRFYEDGTEAGSTAIATQDTNISRDITGGSSNLQLRLRFQETNAVSGAATDDYQLQYSKNAGAYANVTGASTNVLGFNSASLTDGGATTNRLGAGSGSFVAGVVSEDGLADNHQITASNYTEYLFSLTLVFADLANSDTLDFRLLRNGATVAAYSVTPRITITKVTPGSFNAFEPPTLPTTCTTLPVATNSGPIKTKISATTYPLCVVALDSAGPPQILTTFNYDVKVEVVPTTDCLTTATVHATMSPVTLTNGRASVSFNAVANAWPDVSVRISFPTTSPTVTTCSTDNYAIRPNSLSFTVTDDDWETAGTTRALDNTSTPGGTVHKAGRPFTITATAYNGAGVPAITTNYAGTPTASIVSHIIPTSCLNGTACTLSGGTFTDGTPSDGIVRSVTASYAEVGAFNMQLTDTSFAAVDASDSSTAERYVTSGAVAVGRFVPDHFSLSSGSRTPACTTGGSLLSYMDQPFTLVATLVAQNFAGGTTENYHPSSGGYAPATVAWQAENADSGTNLNGAGTRLTNVASAWTNGSYVLNSTTATFIRLGSPDGPYDGLQLGVQLTDPDGPVLGGLDMNAATSGACAPCTAKAVGAPISARYGRLRLLNAYGSELLDIRVPVRAEYFTSTNTWSLNSADNCTVVPSSSIALGNHLPPPAGTSVSATNMGVAPTDHRPVSNLTLTGGSGTIVLSKPNPVATGSFDMVLNLGTGIVSPNSCATGTFAGGTAASLTYLLGNWCGGSYDRAPSARVKLGAAKAPYIYLRERF